LGGGLPVLRKEAWEKPCEVGHLFVAVLEQTLTNTIGKELDSSLAIQAPILGI
jgi:hypothetical protein